MASVEGFLSRRYLFSRGSRWLVSVITFISIAGVTVGVAALITVLGVIEGIDEDIFSKFVDIHPHVKITNRDEKFLRDADKVLAAVKGSPDVRMAEKIVNRQVLFTRTGGDRAATPGQVLGVESIGSGSLYDVYLGGDVASVRLKEDETVLGIVLAHRMGARPGEEIEITTGILARTPNGRMPKRRKLFVSGAYHSSESTFDSLTAFIALEKARSVFNLDENVDYIHLRLHRPFEVDRVIGRLETLLGPEYAFTSWEEENRELFQALKLEKIGLAVILLLVVIVAGFNIVATLILMVGEKTREIGILKAMGASDGMIRRTFLTAGAMIGLMGAGAGLAGGLVLCHIVAGYIRIQPPGSPYGMEFLPVVVKPLNVFLIVASALATSLVAALFPAMQAARLDPVEAIRHD